MAARWSKAEVNDLRRRMQTQGRSVDEIAEEIRHTTGRSKLLAYRMAHGISQTEAAARYEEATGSFMDQAHLSRLEQFPLAGGRAPLAAQLVGLAKIYSTTPIHLVPADALERMDPQERAILMQHHAAYNVRLAVSSASGLASVDSGTTIRTLSAPSTTSTFTDGAATDRGDLERQVKLAARRSLRFSSEMGGSNTTVETLEQITDEIRRLATAYQLQALPTLLADLVHVQDITFRLLEGRQRPSQSQTLYMLAAAASGMMANASHDLGDNYAAMTQARTAYMCADNAEHDGLRTWVRGIQSMVSYWAGWPHDAVRYARLGALPAVNIRSTAAVWIAALEGRAWAAVGNDEEVNNAIQRAQDARERVLPNEVDELGGKLTFPLPRQLYYAADALSWLPGSEEAAESVADQALSEYGRAVSSERSYLDEAIAKTDIALARARRGEIDGANEAISPVLELSPALRIGGVLVNARRIHGVITYSRYKGSAVAKDLQQELEGFCRVTAASALGR
jgi:tetratricopeptide (TPR) repeat protein